MVDGCKVAESTRLIDAILLLGISMYVFNLKVKPSHKNVMWFVATEALNVNPEVKPDPAVINNLQI